MCIGLHTLPPCLLFCGNYILHESEYDVHIFCVALDIIIYLASLRPALGLRPKPHFQKLYGFIYSLATVAKTQQPALLLIDFYYMSVFYSHTVAFAFIQ